VITRRAAPLGAEASRLATLHTAAFAPERGWNAGEIDTLTASPGAALLAAPAGFALIRTVADEAELLTIAVAPGAQGRGLGTALLAAAEDAARAAGAARLFLEVAPGNGPARALYAARGYEILGRRPAYYPRPDGARMDALILSRPLAAAPAAG